MNVYTVMSALSALLESLMMLVMCETFCTDKAKVPAPVYVLCAVAAAALITGANLIFAYTVVNAAAMILAFFALSLLYKLSLKTRVVMAVLNYLIVIVTEVIVLYAVTLIFHITVSEVVSVQFYRISGTVASKILYLLAINVLRIKFRRSSLYAGTTYWSLFLIMLISSVATVFLVFGLSQNMNDTRMYYLSLICSFSLLFTTFCEIYLYERLIKQTQTIKDKERDEDRLKMQLNHLDEILVTQNRYKKFKHDFKNYMVALNGYITKRDFNGADKYIRAMNGGFGLDDYTIETGNTALDAILNTKIAIAKSKGIAVDTMVQVPEMISIAPVDICTIFGNVLDNAIEACDRTDVKDKKITVVIMFQNGALFSKITNTAPKPASEPVRTSKPDKENHGFGLGNIKSALAMYNSAPIVERTDTEFTMKFAIHTKK